METRKDLWPLVEKITMVNQSRSPWSACAPELAGLLGEIKAARKDEAVAAQIFRTKLHSTGAQSTTWQGLNMMQGAGWVIEGPSDALPPRDESYHAEMVLRTITIR